MKLDHVFEGIEAVELPLADELLHPDLHAVRTIRSTIESAVIDDEFLSDCIELELDLIVDTPIRRGLLPFHVMPKLSVRFAFGYWPPGGTPGPHEHTAWTITAVCRNELEVQTFDRAESYRRRELVPKNRFTAASGRVGYIYEPSIHAPINASPDWSLSLHVTSPRDGEPVESCGEPILGLRSARRRQPPSAHPYASVVAARARTERVHVLARALAGMHVPTAGHLLDRCAGLGSHATRALAAKGRGSSAARTLRRTHPELALSHHVVGDTVSMMAHTPADAIAELTVDVVAADAIAYAAREPEFDVRDLPGRITDEERVELAEALEDSGLFTKAA